MADPLIGKTLGQFEVLDVIGQGGMAVVYEAKQSSLDRTIALKFLKSQHAENQMQRAKLLAEAIAVSPLPGYQPVKPMVFAGIYPVEGEDYGNLRDALDKLQLNDASLVFEPETSQALNFGFELGTIDVGVWFVGGALLVLLVIWSAVFSK